MLMSAGITTVDYWRIARYLWLIGPSYVARASLETLSKRRERQQNQSCRIEDADVRPR
jgi:hypothetical protein